MASAVDKQPAAARLAAVAAARCLPTATRGSQNSYTTSGDTTENFWFIAVTEGNEDETEIHACQRPCREDGPRISMRARGV